MTTNNQTVYIDDKLGNLYAKRSKLTVGCTCYVDDSFYCLDPWSEHTLQKDETGLFIFCTEGYHYLEGQIQEDDDTLIGIYPSKPLGVPIHSPSTLCDNTPQAEKSA